MSAAPSAPAAPVARLRAALPGRVFLPEDTEYERARSLFYAGLERRPAAVVRPAGADDVAQVVGVAAETGTDLAVRGGGHGLLGHALIDDGLVLDLGDLRTLDLDVAGRTAWVGAGATAGEYTEAAGAHGLATGFGDTGSVGLGGLTLGGGIGLLVRKHGLTIDQLLAAEVVTADGRIRVVDEDHGADQFWAIRGGGGNVGVVTRLRFRLHEVPTVVGGILVLPATADVIAGFVELAGAAPEELSTIANVMSAAPPLPFLPPEVHGQRVLVAIMAYAGDTAAGQAALAPFRALATPLADLTGPKPYAEMFLPEDEEFHPHAVVETTFRETFDRDTAEAVLATLDSSTAMVAVVQLRVLGGAVARVPNDATAYAHRDRRIMLNVAAMYGDAGERPTHRAWVGQHASGFSEGPVGRYVNFLGDDSVTGARAAYPHGAYERLAAIKRRYDPGNVFRSNVNVPPA